jgi:hypothetical protein
MSLTSASSPFRNVSYDVLREIFFHCLPEHPLDEVQPNTNIAPILLCHVCSSWRAVALSSPFLWSHLHIKLPITWDLDSDDDSEEEPLVRDFEALARDIGFMKWWRTNHGSIAPFLCFDLHRRSWDESSVDPIGPIDSLEPEAEDFFFDYLSSAQYLDVGIFYVYMLRQGVDRGLPIATSSKLHTLVCRWDRFTGNDDPDDEYVYSFELLPFQIPPTLRRLSIQDETITKDYMRRLDNWSTLTHLSLNPVYLLFDIWFSLIRKLVNLQRGEFVFTLFGDLPDAIDPPQYTHSSLSTLTMSCHHNTAEFPLSTLFKNLQLPALRTLYLCSSVRSWSDHRATIEIHNVLKSAPAITKLILGTHGASFLCSAEDFDMPSPIDDNDGLLSMDAPNLLHLEFELRHAEGMDMDVLARRFIKNLLTSGRWLDLTSSTNTIRTITIAVENTANPAIPNFYYIMKDLLMWNIQRYFTTANVSFEVVSVADVGMNGVYMSAWKTWGSKI